MRESVQDRERKRKALHWRDAKRCSGSLGENLRTQCTRVRER